MGVLIEEISQNVSIAVNKKQRFTDPRCHRGSFSGDKNNSVDLHNMGSVELHSSGSSLCERLNKSRLQLPVPKGSGKVSSLCLFGGFCLFVFHYCVFLKGSMYARWSK